MRKFSNMVLNISILILFFQCQPYNDCVKNSNIRDIKIREIVTRNVAITAAEFSVREKHSAVYYTKFLARPQKEIADLSNHLNLSMYLDEDASYYPKCMIYIANHDQEFAFAFPFMDEKLFAEKTTEHDSIKVRFGEYISFCCESLGITHDLKRQKHFVECIADSLLGMRRVTDVGDFDKVSLLANKRTIRMQNYFLKEKDIFTKSFGKPNILYYKPFRGIYGLWKITIFSDRKENSVEATFINIGSYKFLKM